MLASLHCDEVSRTCKRDEMIILFGKQLFKKHGRSQEIRLQMRLLARLLNIVNAKREVKVDLMQCIDSSHFDAVLTATEVLAGAFVDETGHRNMAHPSNAKNVGHSLIRCAAIKSVS